MALILVAAIVVVVLVVSNQVITKTPSHKPDTTPESKLTLNELVAEYQRLVTASGLPHDVFVKARFGLKDTNGAFVHRHASAKEWALKSVELFGCEKPPVFPDLWHEAAVVKQIEKMNPIGKKMIIGNPKYTAKDDEWKDAFFKLFKEEECSCKGYYALNKAWGPIMIADGDDTVYYVERPKKYQYSDV